MKDLPYPLLAQAVAIPALAVAIVLSFIYLPGQPVALQYVFVMVLAYLVGSLSWGYILLRWRQGMDIREYGSGRTGMANVLRTGGGKVAAVVFALDVGKGVLAVIMAKEATGASGAEVAAALAALVGHNWPVFLGFRGGRGILTALGGLSMMTPVPAAVATVTFLVLALGSRYISLGSISGALAGAVTLIALVALAGWYSQAYIIFAGVATTMLIWQHRDNIQRLMQGNERRIGTPATPVE
jgi:glycerol-3-phosphate acyltransferase PlsY